MGSPVHTARGVPTGFKVPEGYKTTITFALVPAVNFWEQEVQPPGFDTGEFINTTTMLNTRLRTMIPPALVTMTPMAVTAFYDPDVIYYIYNVLLGHNGSCTVAWPDGSSVDFFGALKSFKPQKNVEARAQLADIEVVPTNWDSVSQSEQAFVLNQAAGT